MRNRLPLHMLAGGSPKRRLIIAAVIVAFTLFSYLGSSSVNPITGEKQKVSLTVDQEIALGIQSAPEMAQQYGGLDKDRTAQVLVKKVGGKLLFRGVQKKIPYQFDFHLLADQKVVNAFALPGGQIFITRALLDRFNSEDQLAGVIAHEIGHVLERHGAEHLAKANLTQGLAQAAGIAVYDPNRPGTAAGAQIAQAIGQLVNMKYGRDDELESDRWAVRLTTKAGYRPEAMIEVMEILSEAHKAGRPPEFMSTHPASENRVAVIREEINKLKSLS
ncbi:MAG: M48 family metalloprotease [Bdellovibrionota bacterium]